MKPKKERKASCKKLTAGRGAFVEVTVHAIQGGERLYNLNAIMTAPHMNDMSTIKRTFKIRRLLKLDLGYSVLPFGPFFVIGSVALIAPSN